MLNDIIGARYWYQPTKQYGYELSSFEIDKFWNKETGQISKFEIWYN